MFLFAQDKKQSYILTSTREGLDFFDLKDYVLTENLPFFEVKDKKGVFMFFHKLTQEVEVFRYATELFAEEVTFESIVKHTIPKMMAILDDNDLLDEENTTWENTAIIVCNGKVFSITTLFEVIEETDYFTRGINHVMTLGCLASDETLPIKNRLANTIYLLQKIEAIDLFPVTLFNVKTATYKHCFNFDELLSE